jgi:hypothetical protein
VPQIGRGKIKSAGGQPFMLLADQIAGSRMIYIFFFGQNPVEFDGHLVIGQEDKLWSKGVQIAIRRGFDSWPSVIFLS